MVTATAAPDDSTELTIGYTYDLNGLRTGKTVTTRTFSTHTHNYTTTVVAPTCTTDGYTLHECACGDSYQDSTVSKLGHAYQQVSQSGGTITYRCTRCGHIHYSSEIIIPPQPPTDPPVIASLGDDENAEAAPLTETETGETDPLGEAGDEPSTTSTGSGDGRSLISTVTEHHDYIYASGQLLRETITTTAADGTVTVEILDFAYDNAGTPYALTYTNGTTSTTYYYITNLQGDVMYLVEANGDTAAEYAYDAYGKITTATGSMAEINPLRYRGYYYDKESDFYYLQSRYYDSVVCRFINADEYVCTGQGFSGQNMFAYCGNSPACRLDAEGTFFFTALGAVIGGAFGFVDALIAGEDPLKGAEAGAVSGAIAGAGVDVAICVTAATGGVGAGVAIAAGMGALSGVVGTGISTDWTADPLEYTASAIVGAGCNVISFGLAPMNGEIVKGPVCDMLDQIVIDGFSNLTENITTGTILAGAATWITRVVTKNYSISQD